MANQIAQTILEQLGGNRFIAMTGAKQFVAGDKSLQFAIGRGAKDGINKIRVTLGADGLYAVEFWKIRGADMKLVYTSTAVYAELLAQVFANVTGLDTRL